MKLEYKKICRYLSVLVYVVYLYTSGLASYIFGTWQNIIAVLLGAAVLGYIANTGFPKIRIVKAIKPVDLLVVIMLIAIIFNNADIKNGSYINTVATLSIFLFYLVSKNDNRWMEIATNLLFYGGLFHAVASFILYLLPNVYMTYVMPLFVSFGYESTLLYCVRNGYAVGLTPHYSTNAMYMSVALGAAFIRLTDRRFKGKPIMNKINIALTAFILFVLILTGKRAHCVFALVCLFAAYYVYNSDKPKNRLMKTLALIAVGGIALALIVEIAPDAVPVIRRFIYMSQLEDSSLGRNARMLLALNLFLRNALTGIGWNGFTYYYNATFGDWLNVHNVYLQLLCEEGLLFSLAFFAFFIVSFLHAWNALKQSRVQKLDGINESLLLYSVYIQAFFLLYSLTGNPLYDAPFLFPYIFGCAFGEYYYRKVKELTAYES